MSKRPNVLIVLADDLGYSDLGCFGSEIRTPNIDKLAEEGLRFSDFHTSPLCSPSRAMLLSGTDCHLAGLGTMNENPSLYSEWRGRRGFEGYLNHDVVTVAELLEESGYVTLMSGKWHLGYKRGSIPCDRGFQKSLSMLVGAHNHFGWNPDWRAEGLEKPPRPVGGSAPIYVKDDTRWMPTANTTDDPIGYYSSDFFADTMIGLLKETEYDRCTNEKPFLAYLPFSAPHTPIQCFKRDRDGYKGMFDDGPEALRARRLNALERLGFIKDVTPHPIMVKGRRWKDMTDWQQQYGARTYECYAGMVEALDRATGRVLEYLRETGDLDNTLVLVLSDNGPASGSLNTPDPELRDALGPDPDQAIGAFYDNTLANLGAYNSFPRPSPEWAQASSAPHRLFKGMPTEGGIRVPLVLRYPPVAKYHSPGSITHSFATVMDIMPTILHLAGVSHPNPGQSPTTLAPWKDRQVYPMRGQDWTPYLLRGINPPENTLSNQTEQLVGRRKLFLTPGEGEAIWGEGSPAVGWEMHGRAAVRKGKWKIVNVGRDFWGTEEWQLYDLDVDQGEIHDLASELPEKLQAMLAYWKQYQTETGAYLSRERVDVKVGTKDAGDPTPGQTAWSKVPIGETLPSHPPA